MLLKATKKCPKICKRISICLYLSGSIIVMQSSSSHIGLQSAITGLQVFTPTSRFEM